MLVVPELGVAMVEAVILEAELVSYEYSGVGYFVTVKHLALPTARTVCQRPIVVGTSGGIEGGFLVFVADGELMLECYTSGAIEVTEDFRDQQVAVSSL